MKTASKELVSGVSAPPYDHYFAYLFDELRKLDILLEAAFRQKSAGVENGKSFVTDLYISTDYVSSLFSGKTAKTVLSEEVRRQYDEADCQIGARLAASREKGISFSLDHCVQLFSLSEPEKIVLLLALAPRLDSRYDKIFSYFHDSLEGKSPSVQIVYDLLTLLYSTNEGGPAIFSEYGSLMYWNLIRFEGGGVSPAGRAFSLEPYIAGYLLGDKLSLQKEFFLLEELSISWENLAVSLNTFEQLQNISRLLQAGPDTREDVLIVLSGAGELGKFKAVQALLKDTGLCVIEIDTELLLENDEGMENKLRMAIRAAALMNGALFFKKIEGDFSQYKGINRFLENFVEEFLRYNIPVFFSVSETVNIPRAFKHQFYNVHFEVPDYEMRKQIWLEMNKNYCSLSEELMVEFANGFEFTEDQIIGAFEHARKHSVHNADSKISAKDLLAGCRSQADDKLEAKGQSLETSYSMQDVVLPEELYEQIFEIVHHYRFKHQVYDKWGFGKKVAYGRGISVLFSGPSGTGKTMTASVIGNELKVYVYKIDLSSVISKYIGETEKNLSRIFQEAATSNSILFFDEADAIFGKRTEVKDSHDRYANIEVSYLLQKMEEYEGITILASNFRQNIDEAFLRRMQFVLEFPFPDKAHRRKIWQKIFPEEAPVAGDIDFDFLAEKLDVAGGNIKNMAVSAAFIASGEASSIGMRHLLLAAKREYKKLNKSFLEHDFSPYYELIVSKKIKEGRV